MPEIDGRRKRSLGGDIYSKTELDTILTTIKKLNADKKAIYLNNDHGMLENGLYLLKTLQQVELK